MFFATAALLVSQAAVASPTALEQVRIFVGEDHAQVLLVADGILSQPESRSTAAVGRAPARASLSFSGLELSDDLREAYTQEEGRWIIPVDHGGVRRVTLAEVSGSLKVSIEFDEARALDLTSLADHAILADLRVAGAAADPSLPQPEMLASWVAGVSLQRRSQGTVRPRRLVVVDPGHGGRDSGAIGVTGTHESDIALALARRVARQLERTANAEVVLTRTEDVFIPLHERAAIANALDADLFLSIHANAAPAPTVWGIETYYLDTASDAGAARVAARENAIGNTQGPVESIVSDLLVTGTNRLSRELAQSVQADVILDLREVYGEEQIRDLGHKAALFAVLVWTRMPSVLFEAAFLTHPDDEMRLRNPLYQQTVAESIAVSVEAWFEAQGR